MFDPFYPFDWLAIQIVTQLLSLSITSPFGSSLHFFLYDIPKILTLLLVISFLIGTFQSFLEPERVRTLLEGRRTFAGNILAAMVGIVTPFCSCSAVPLFIGFLEAGVPLGVTFSYLMAAPMVNEVAVILLWGLFGLKVTLIYIGFGVGLAIVSGYIIGLLKVERWVEPFVWELQKARQVRLPEDAETLEPVVLTWRKRFEQGQFQASEIVRSVWLYVVIGVAIGAGIHGYVPTAFIAQYASASNPLAVPLAVILGVPLYANIAGVMPITEALVNKGVPMGTVLAFTMSVTALSLPEMVILKKVLQPQLLAVFVGLMTLGIISIGYIFNALL
ncbi:MAG: permease [Oscillatoriophycideae cyanobacterium NC_groundwater_1537_Pr4_S-0.65um_50_18]|nr:permease [Oscillatoriophycideae cyanobacterium NC_groundwater_1537_Pr4_S-0.65um_50_18]